ncbi:MAG: glycosyltransferase family 2 protein, partial [Bacteroidetes bacterium]|nr:glycosyltransferase family 2 protein [Bacteroidota bacterium]
EAHFSSDIPADGCSIRFEHPLSGNDYPPEVYSGIVNYELYLRYYKQGLQYANLPFAFHTIGSSMAVRAGAYMKSGGMNMRKAGEDFYFLQKIIELGRFTELNSTCIYPSPRPSSRVPFGTGMAIEKWLQGRNDLRVTFDPGIFYDLKLFCKLITGLDYRQMTAKKIENRLSEALRSFLSGNGFEDNLEEIKNNSATQNNFLKRFFRWFNAFRTLKFVHFARDNFYGNIPIEAAAGELLSEIYPGKKAVDAVNLLREYRILDAGQFA